MPSLPSRRRWRKTKRPVADPGKLREEATEVREVVSSLDKVEKAAGLYPAGSGVLRDFVDDLHAKLSKLLARTHVLELAVGADEIEYEGEQVYDGTKSERSLAFTLEDGGVRRLVFLEGIEKQEIAGLVDSLREARERDSEDLVTLLWQRNLRHVSYVTVNFYSDPQSDSIIESINPDRARATLIDRLRGREISIDQIAAVRSGRGDPAPEPEGADIYSLTAAEGAEVQRRISDYSEESSAAPLARVLLSLLTSDSGEEANRDRLTALQQTLLDLLDEGDILAAAEVVVTVRRMADASTVAASNVSAKLHANAMRTFITNAAKKEIGQKIAPTLLRARDAEVRAVQEYLRGCGRHSFFVAGELLGISPHDARILQAVAETCKTDFAHLRDFVVDQNPRVAAAAVRVLAEVAGDSARGEFMRATSHKDAGVRREGFLALARCRDPRALDRLIEAFDDPDADIRASALKAFLASIVKPRPEMFGRVQMLVEDHRFAARTPAEQTLIYAILGRVEPDKGVPVLEKVIGRFAIFRREQAYRRRLAAINALGEIANQRAETVLQKLADTTRSEDLLMACRASLDRMEVVRATMETSSPLDRSGVLRALGATKTKKR